MSIGIIILSGIIAAVLACTVFMLLAAKYSAMDVPDDLDIDDNGR